MTLLCRPALCSNACNFIANSGAQSPTGFARDQATSLRRWMMPLVTSPPASRSAESKSVVLDAIHAALVAWACQWLTVFSG